MKYPQVEELLDQEPFKALAEKHLKMVSDAVKTWAKEKRMKPITSGTIAVYECIEKYHSLEGQSPSIMRIMAELGYRSRSSVHNHIQTLLARGWLTSIPHMQHTFVPVRYPRVYYRTKGT